MPDYTVHHLQPGKTQDASWPVAEVETQELVRSAMISGKISGALEHGLYQPIAQARCAEIHEIYPITNHIEHDWTTNPEVIQVSGRQRSTSVGDIAVDLEAGKAWVCQSIGWGEIEDQDQVARLIEASKNFLQSDGAPAASPH